MNLFVKLLPSLVKIYEERIKNKSSAIATVPLALSAALVTGSTPIPADSLEGLILQVVSGLVGIYLLSLKDKT